MDSTKLDSVEPLLEKGLPEFGSARRRKHWLVPTPGATHLIVLFLAGLGLLGIGVFIGQTKAQNAKSMPSRPGSGLMWRDGLSEIGWEYTRFDGSAYLKGPNKYRGKPSDEIDEEWDRFTTNPWMGETAVVLNVSAQEAHRSMNDRSLDTVVTLGDENGGGYMGTIELFHQLHCLNILRKWTYIDYYQPIDPFWTMSNTHQRDHTDHCIDMIRQALMCNGDTGLILFHWIKGKDVPTPDFHTMHQCVDPEAVLQWAKAQRAPITHKIERVDGAKEMSDFPQKVEEKF